jgi:hypothetical protein
MARISDISPSRADVLVAVGAAVGLVAAAISGGSYSALTRSELFAVVLWILTMALAFGLAPRHRLPRTGAVAVAALAGLAGWGAVGLVWTESAERTVTEVARTIGFAGLLLLAMCTLGGRGWRAAALAVAGAAALVCWLAFVSRLAPELLPNPLAASGVRLRLAFPLNYWNALGSWAAMTTALCLAWSAHASARSVRGVALASLCIAIAVAYLTYSRATVVAVGVAVVAVVALSPRRWQTVLNAALAALGAAVVILAIRAHPQIAEGTGTRGALSVGLVAALVVFAAVLAGVTGVTQLLDRRRMGRRTARATLLATAVVAIAVTAVLGPALAAEAWDSFSRRDEIKVTDDPAQRLSSLSGVRSKLWAAGLDAFRDHPLGGTGAGTYEFVWNRDPRRDSPVRDAHSLYVETLAELGVPGALFLVLALGSLLVAAVRSPARRADANDAGVAAGCVAVLIVFCVTAGVDWLWEVPAVTSLALVCGGLAAVAGAPPAPRPRLPGRAAAAVLAFVCLAVQLPVLAGAAELRASRDAGRAGRLDDAVSHAASAIAVQPWAATGYLQRALVLERGGRLHAAARDARRATDREPTNWQPWLVLARIEAERGRVSAAVRAARRARAANPSSPLFRVRGR